MWLGRRSLQGWWGVQAGFTINTGVTCDANRCLLNLGQGVIRYGGSWNVVAGSLTLSGTFAERQENMGTVGTWDLGTPPQFMTDLLN